MQSIHLADASRALRRRAPVHPFAGVCAGLVAGIAYLGLQLLLAGVLDSNDPWLPLERLSAMLLGDDVVADPAFNLNLAGIGLLVHFAVSMVYGRFVDLAVRDAPLPRAALIGAGLGLVLYAVAFRLVAPVFFPWFTASPPLITAFDHLVFGAVAGACYALLRRRWPAVAR